MFWSVLLFVPFCTLVSAARSNNCTYQSNNAYQFYTPPPLCIWGNYDGISSYNQYDNLTITWTTTTDDVDLVIWQDHSGIYMQKLLENINTNTKSYTWEVDPKLHNSSVHNVFYFAMYAHGSQNLTFQTDYFSINWASTSTTSSSSSGTTATSTSTPDSSTTTPNSSTSPTSNSTSATSEYIGIGLGIGLLCAATASGAIILIFMRRRGKTWRRYRSASQGGVLSAGYGGDDKIVSAVSRVRHPSYKKSWNPPHATVQYYGPVEMEHPKDRHSTLVHESQYDGSRYLSPPPIELPSTERRVER